jgi:hypothetical protein
LHCALGQRHAGAHTVRSSDANQGEKCAAAISPSLYRFEVQEDIDIRPFIAKSGSNFLAARRLTDHLQDYFTQEKVRHGVG